MSRAGGTGRRRGFGLLEAVCALALLAAVAWPLVTLVVGSGRSSAGASQRMVLELRARRHLIAAASAPFESLPAFGRAPSVAALPEPAEAPGYLDRTDALEEETQATGLAPGLALVVTRLRWKDRATGATDDVVARRVVLRPTFGLEHQPASAEQL